MADEDVKNQAEVKKDAKADAPTSKESFLSKKNIIIMTVMVLILGIGTFAGFKIFIEKDSEGDVQKFEKVAIGTVHEFETILVNVAGTEGTRYLKVEVSIEFNEVNLTDEITSRKMQLLDILTTIFSGKTLEQVVDLNAREGMKREIRDKFNAVLIGGQIRNVFFAEFVIQ